MKNFRKLCILLLITLIGLQWLTPCASAKSADSSADPQFLIEVIARRLDIPADSDTLVELGIITEPEQRFFREHQCITRAIAWRVLLPLYGILPYPSEFYPDIPKHTDCNDFYNDARVAAILSGLATADTIPNLRLSQDELLDLLYQLQNGYFTLLTPPVPIPDHLSDITWTYENYRYRNACMLASYIIPDAWLQDFHDQNWSIKCKWQLDDNAPVEIAEKYHSAGVTNYTDKTIYLSSYTVKIIAHEFTHYAANRLKWKHDYLSPYYEAEASNLAEILGAYSQAKPAEYFAEFVAYWLIHPDERAALLAIAPQTSQLAISITSDYASLLANP